MSGFKNSTRMRSGFSFPESAGFTHSGGNVRSVTGYTRRAPVRKAFGGKIATPAVGVAPPTRLASQPRLPPKVTQPRPVSSPLGAAVRAAARPVAARVGAVRRAEGGSVSKKLDAADQAALKQMLSRAKKERQSSLKGGLTPEQLRAIAGGALTESEAGRLKAITPVERAKGGKVTSGLKSIIESARQGIIKPMSDAEARAETVKRMKAADATPVKKARGGSVGNSATLRTKPVTEFDAQHGGRGPLRPGFQKGGALDQTMTRKVARQEVAKHVARPAPKGHKGLKSC